MPATPVASLAKRGRLALPIPIITFFIFISAFDSDRVSARQKHWYGDDGFGREFSTATRARCAGGDLWDEPRRRDTVGLFAPAPARHSGDERRHPGVER